MITFRDLKRNNQLQEAMGLTNRKMGDVFSDGKTPEPRYKFIGLSKFYNEEEENHPLSGSENAIQDSHIPDKENITWIPQKRNKAMTTYAVVHFKEIDTNKDFYFGKYFNKFSKNWSNSEAGFFSFRAKSTIKEKSKLQPSDILPKSNNLTRYDILKAVENLPLSQNNPALYKVLLEMVNDTIKYGYPNSTSGYDMTGIDAGEVSAITDYFSELLHPIAILKKNYDGNALEGINSFFGDKVDYNNILIEFPTAKNQGLYDSALTLGNKKLLISSKFGSSSQSAKPSVTNLISVYNDYADKSIFDSYEKEIQIAKYINDYSGKEGPILIAKDILNLINDEELNTIRSLEAIHVDNNIKDKTEAYESIKLTENLQELHDLIKTASTEKDDKFIHLISGIARKVANVVNEPQQANKTSKFSEFASNVLNGNIIQVYTRIRNRGNILYFSKFNTVWPDDSVTNIMLDALTRYRTNAITGKLGFVIKYKDNTVVKL